MHVHLPKPLHGWRAFVGEVGVIVLGVLIALSAEALVENWRWHVRANEARDRLRAEVGHEFLVAEERTAVEQCIDQQLAKIEDAVLASGAVMKPLPLYRETGELNLSYTFRTPSRIWVDSAWRSVISEGLSAHLSARERDLLPVHYADVNRAAELNAEEGATVGELASLARQLPLDPQVKSELVRSIEQERHRNEALGAISTQMMRFIGRIGYVPTAPARRRYLQESGTIKFCRSRGFLRPIRHQ